MNVLTKNSKCRSITTTSFIAILRSYMGDEPGVVLLPFSSYRASEENREVLSATSTRDTIDQIGRQESSEYRSNILAPNFQRFISNKASYSHSVTYSPTNSKQLSGSSTLYNNTTFDADIIVKEIGETRKFDGVENFDGTGISDAANYILNTMSYDDVNLDDLTKLPM